MRVTPWLLVLTIESGYLLGNWSQPVTANQAWLMAGLSLTAVGLGLACCRKKRTQILTKRLRSQALERLLPYLPWFTVTIILGELYGYLQSVNVPGSVTEELGRPVFVQAMVQGVHPFAGGLTINLQVTSIRTGAQERHTRVDAVWFLRDPQVLDNDWTEGSRVALSGTLTKQAGNSGNARAYLPEAGPTYQFIGHPLQLTPAVPSVPDQVRNHLHASVEKVMGSSQEADLKLLESIVFGGSELDQSTKQTFLAAGLLHILAASGANVLLLQQFLEVGVFRLWRKMRLPYSLWIAALIVFLWFFAGLCGFAPSIVRATTMSSYALLGRLLQRPVSTFSGLRITALIEVLWDPALFSNVSSILSFAATAAVANALVKVRQPPHSQRRNSWTYRLKRMYAFWRQTLLVSLWVDLYLIPVTMAFFQQVTPFGVVSNFLAEPLLNLLLPLAAAFMFLSSLEGLAEPIFWVAQLLGRASFLLLHVLTGVVKTIASWPFSLVELSMPSLWWAVLYYAALLLLKRRDKKFVKK